MRIGLDLDDTICMTSELLYEKAYKYCEDNNTYLNYLLMNHEEKWKFYDVYMKEVYENAPLHKDAKRVINKLKKDGNTLVIITARNNTTYKNIKDVESLVKTFLDKNGIEVDKIEIDCYGMGKADACKRNNIDIMIDDSIYNHNYIVDNTDTKCILLDRENKYPGVVYHAVDWKEIEKVIDEL